jgi:hypothetical protein
MTGQEWYEASRTESKQRYNRNIPAWESLSKESQETYNSLAKIMNKNNAAKRAARQEQK